MAHRKGGTGREFVGIVERVVYIVYIEDSRISLHSKENMEFGHMTRGGADLLGAHVHAVAWFGRSKQGSGVISVKQRASPRQFSQLCHGCVNKGIVVDPVSGGIVIASCPWRRSCCAVAWFRQKMP